jgi:FkbM family methyltransferase
MPEANLIYDVGAHGGGDTRFYLSKGFSVVAVEASPELCRHLENEFRDYVKSGRLTILNIAVTEAVGEIDFYLNDTLSIWNTADIDMVRRSRRVLGRSRNRIRKISVEGRPLSDIMHEYGVPHYCKIDIEGSDLTALKSLRNLCVSPPHFISIESEKAQWDKLLEEFCVFDELGYSRYKIIDQDLIRFQRCPKPAKEGSFCDCAFGIENSGLFGDELPGPWLSLFDAVAYYKRIYLGYSFNGDHGLLSWGSLGCLEALYKRLLRLRGIREYKSAASIAPPAGWHDTHAAR